MSAKFPKGTTAPATPAATALPPTGTGKAPANPLSGAFAAALGGKAQLPHSGPKKPQQKGAGPRLPAGRASAQAVKNSKPGMPTVPRKGHR